MEKKIPIDEIITGKRVRKVFGDVKSLAASIEKVGLLQAIAVTKDNKLICGQRRLRAVESLGHKTIDCRIVDISDMKEAEWAENEFRKSLTLSEKAELANAISLTQGGHKKTGRPHTKKLSQNGRVSGLENSKQFTTQEIAIRAGFSGNQEMARVTTVTKQGDRELVDAMDTGKIKPSKAAEIAVLPKAEQRKILDDARTEDGRYSFTKPSAVKAKGPSMAESELKFLEKILALPWGIEDQYGSVAQMFDSDTWQRKENKGRIGEYAEMIESIAKVYGTLSHECQAYCKKHKIYGA